jgi:hypothetical protein
MACCCLADPISDPRGRYYTATGEGLVKFQTGMMVCLFVSIVD